MKMAGQGPAAEASLNRSATRWRFERRMIT